MADKRTVELDAGIVAAVEEFFEQWNVKDDGTTFEDYLALLLMAGFHQHMCEASRMALRVFMGKEA